MLAVLGPTSRALGLNEPTHELVNREAARSSGLDGRLKNTLGFTGGLQEPFQGTTALRWLELGGRYEDQGRFLNLLGGTARYLRHFHDPLQPWDTAGLRLITGQFESSVRWMQRADQDMQAVGGKWAWADARRYYFTALTAPSPTAREQAFADTFRALGQLTHLVTDASVPEHTRNDIHPMGFAFGNYEYWVSNQHGLVGSAEEAAFVANFLASPLRPDPAVQQHATGDGLATMPVARLIDTDTYRGLETGPNVTLGPAIGIAEVANANFFSEDTGNFPFPYPFPNPTILERVTLPLPNGRVRAYFAKGANDGLAVAPVLAECVLYEPAAADRVVQPVVRNCTDEVVWANVADQMLPRAVGYSAALLDYFFRGQLGGRVEQRAGGRTLRVWNFTPGEAMQGDVALYYDAVDGTRVEQARWTGVSLAPGDEAPGLDIPPPAADRPPADANQYLLVFVGQLGGESGNAVAARWIRTTPVILVGFAHEGTWASGWPLSDWGRYYKWDPGTVQIMEEHLGEPNFSRLEQIGVDLYSALVPQNPDAPIEFQRVPWEFIGSFDTNPAPVRGYAAGPRWFVNYTDPPPAGVSVLGTDASWRVTVNWADSVPLDPRARGILGEDAAGNVDLSPRVVRVCPGLDLTAGLFGPSMDITHPWLGRCPDWWTFGD